MPLRDLGLKKFWSAVRGPNGREPSPQSCEEGRASPGDSERRPAVCSLPLLQVWPSQDSPRGEADGQSFVFPPPDDLGAACDLLGQQNDSGIDSVQVSPSPGGSGCCPGSSQAPPTSSPSPTPGASRRPSCALLHPDHARLLRPPVSPDTLSMEDIAEFQAVTVGLAASCSSSTTSSMTSIAAAVAASTGARSSDPGVDRRRSSTMTARYSLLDALDLEYALLRAAARGSVGPYSLSESLHKLTFTQSLAFPALARGLAGKQRRSAHSGNSRPLDPQDTGFNAFAKVVTALVLVLVSVLVFAVVYKFVRT